jgi:dolichol-phosphate mannosyltransferase
MSHSKTLGIVTPLANEEQTIDEFLSRTLQQIPENGKVFCVLDNASKDSTKEKIQKYSEKDPRVILVWAPENRSAVDAYFRGYKEALDADCDWILEMDGGLSHLPEEIPRFIEAMQNGYEFAGGSRFIKGSNYIKPGKRYLISRAGTILSNLLLGTKMKDMTSGFECFSRDSMKHVLTKGVQSKAHFFQTEIRCMMHNFKWKEVPITYKDPSNSVSGSSIKDALKNLWELRKSNKINN